MKAIEDLRKEFIKKWNVAFENKEDELALAQEMMDDLNEIIEQQKLTEPKEPVKSAEDILTECGVLNREIHKEDSSTLHLQIGKEKYDACKKAMEEYRNQSHPVKSADGDLKYSYKDLCDLVESLKDYTHESHNILGNDEREPNEFVDIFLSTKYKSHSQAKPVVSDMRSLLDGFYSWLDDLTQNEFDNMSLTEKCESYFIGKDLSLTSEGKESYLICSKCKQPDGTVKKGMFDGMCADCTQSEL